MAQDVKIVVSAKDEASRVLAQVRGSLSQVSSVAATVGSAIGLMGVASVGGLLAMAKSAIDGLDALNDFKDATGSSIENASALEDVALRTGTSFDTVVSAVTKLNSALNAAKPDSAQAQAIEAIGLSVQDLKDLDPAEALLKIAVAMSGFADDGNKARIFQVLFGKSLKDVAPLLNDLAEKGQLVATVTKEQAAEAEALNKEFFSLQKNIKDLSRFLVNDLVIGFNKAAKAYRESGFLNGIKTFFTGDDEHKQNVKLVEDTDALLQAEQALSGFRREGYKDDAKVVVASKAKIASLQAEIKATMALRNPVPSYTTGDGIYEKPSVGNLPDKPTKSTGRSARSPTAPKEQIDAASQSLASYVEGLERSLQTTQDLSAAQKALTFLRTIGATGEITQVRQMVLGMAEQVDLQQELSSARKQANASIDKQAGELTSLTTENQGLLERVQAIGLSKDALNALTLARLDDAIATESQTMAEAAMANASQAELALMQRKIDLLREQRGLTARGQIAQADADTSQAQETASKDYAATLQNDLKGALSNAFRDTKDPIGAFGDALGNIVFTRVSTALANSMIDSLMGSAGGAGGAASLLSLIGFDGGGYTGAAARTGGLDGKGGFVAMLHPQETVIDHTKGQSTPAQAIVVHQNFTVGDVASVSMVRQAVAGSERRIAAGLGRSMSYGGALS